MVRSNLTVRHRAVLHFLWYSILCPFLATVAFVCVRGSFDRGFSLGLSVSVSVIGSLLIVFLVMPLLIAIAVLAFIATGFLRRGLSLVTNGLIVFASPWVLLKRGPDLFTDHPMMIAIEATVFAAITVFLYDRFGMYALFLKDRR